MRRIIHLLITAGMAVAAHAQETKIEAVPATENPEKSTPRKLPNTLEPTPEAPAPSNLSPDEVVAGFFEALKADRVDAAYEKLGAQFAFQGRSEDASKMREQTQRALDAYGPVVGWELIKEEKIGTHLTRRTYLLAGQSLPLRWMFYFYKAGENWQLIDLRVDDALVEWFREQ